MARPVSAASYATAYFLAKEGVLVYKIARYFASCYSAYLAQTQFTSVRYFGLYQAEAGETKEQTDDLETLTHLVSLDEEIAQTTRFQRVLDKEDADA